MLDSIYKRNLPNGDVEIVVNTSGGESPKLDFSLKENTIIVNGIKINIDFALSRDRLFQIFDYRIDERGTVYYIHFMTIEEIKGLENEIIYKREYFK